jgi:hypothetical protein
MRLFPSMPAAIVTGAVGMPLLIWGWKFIEAASHSQLLVLVWAIVRLHHSGCTGHGRRAGRR